MLEAEWAWIVTEQALDASNIPNGVIGVRLLQVSEVDHVADAVRIATQSILHLVRSDYDAMKHLHSVKACSDNPSEIQSKSKLLGRSTYLWKDYAIKLFRQMLAMNLTDGRTGHLEFNEYGDRIKPIYDIVNAQIINQDMNGLSTPKSIEFERPTLVSVGSYGVPQPTPIEWLSDEPHPPLLSINSSKLVWPGNSIVKRQQLVCIQRANDGKCQKTEKRLVHAAPISFKKKTHLKVVTIESVPFVHTRPKLNDKCKESDDPSVFKAEIECTHTDPVTGVKKHYCCYGYCIDLLRLMANRTGLELTSTPFTYDLHLVGDGQIGDIDENETHKWTGIIGEILSSTADLAVAPVSITPERAARVEFTKPFKYLGITILVKRERARSNLGSFLQPFESSLWVLVALSVHVVAFVLYLLDRFSPFGQTTSDLDLSTNGSGSYSNLRQLDSENQTSDKSGQSITHLQQHKEQSQDGEEGMNLSTAVYFAWAVLLNSGIGEGTPRSFSARVLGMVWAGFAMIIVASYTANLAAFLVLDRPEASISGIDDVRLRNPQKDFLFATIRGSPVEMYFKRQVEFATMYRVMETNNYDSVEEAIQAIKSGSLKAFIWDSARLNYEVSIDCELITAGEVFGRNSYGLVMKKNNPWLYELSQAVLNFHERGIMETLDTKWIHIKSNNCERTESSPATLGLTNMAGVFIMIGMGLVAGAILTLVEVLCAKRKGERKKKLELSSVAVQHWRDNIQKRHSELHFQNATEKQMQFYPNDSDKQPPQDIIQRHLLTNINMKTSNNIKSNLLMNAKETYPTTEYDMSSTKSKMNRKRKASDDYSDEDDGVNDTQLFPYHITKNNNSLNEDYCITAYRCDQDDSDDDDDDDDDNNHNDELVEEEQEQQDNEEEELMSRENELAEEDLNELIHHNNTFTVTNRSNKNNHYHRHHTSNMVSAV
ncbi:Glutamate [NMDA] receptor subunit 1 [Schistosoma japonicum]|uniref:Glutamate [NMDA] receptor subunit 1 n=1 Tax=Schistosoma japonicum TaxID=6182 RepID=A0A4Z2D3T5_SCHJA|nr:Glutamate [NMDA] receptor subunit 1 [Schistosoma japonicum]